LYTKNNLEMPHGKGSKARLEELVRQMLKSEKHKERRERHLKMILAAQRAGDNRVQRTVRIKRPKRVPYIDVDSL
jgi:hypothetical protein